MAERDPDYRSGSPSDRVSGRKGALRQKNDR
jgi:hypothetical protein